MAATRPTLPAIPENANQFAELVSQNPREWLDYCQAAYNYQEYLEKEIESLKQHVLEQQDENLRNQEGKETLRQQYEASKVIIEFQRTESKELQRQLYQAENDRNIANPDNVRTLDSMTYAPCKL